MKKGGKSTLCIRRHHILYGLNSSEHHHHPPKHYKNSGWKNAWGMSGILWQTDTTNIKATSRLLQHAHPVWRCLQIINILSNKQIHMKWTEDALVTLVPTHLTNLQQMFRLIHYGNGSVWPSHEEGSKERVTDRVVWASARCNGAAEKRKHNPCHWIGLDMF